MSHYPRELMNAVMALQGGTMAEGFRVVEGSPFPSRVVFYQDDTQTKKIVECIVTRDAAQRPTVIVVNSYAQDGVTLHTTFTDTITRTKGLDGRDTPFEKTRTRVIS